MRQEVLQPRETRLRPPIFQEYIILHWEAYQHLQKQDIPLEAGMYSQIMMETVSMISLPQILLQEQQHLQDIMMQ